MLGWSQPELVFVTGAHWALPWSQVVKQKQQALDPGRLAPECVLLVTLVRAQRQQPQRHLYGHSRWKEGPLRVDWVPLLLCLSMCKLCSHHSRCVYIFWVKLRGRDLGPTSSWPLRPKVLFLGWSLEATDTPRLFLRSWLRHAFPTGSFSFSVLSFLILKGPGTSHTSCGVVSSKVSLWSCLLSAIHPGGKA